MHFSPITRMIFFLILACFFVVSATLLIAYTFGYRYNFDRAIFVYSGSITLKTNPQQVDIVINGKPLEQKKVNFINGSHQIDGLKPGKYEIKLSAPGFNDWSKWITVESGRSTEFWNIILAKQTYETTNLPFENVIGLFPSPTARYIAVSQFKNGEFTTLIYDTDRETSEQVFSSKTYTRFPFWKSNIEWSPNEKKLLIPVKEMAHFKEKDLFSEQNLFERPDEIYLVNLEEKTSETLFPHLPQKTQPRNIRWGPGSESLFGITDNTLFSMENLPEQGEWSMNTLYDDVLSYDFSSTDIYLMRTNGILYKGNRNGKNEEQITTSIPDHFDNVQDISLIAYDQDRLAALSQNGTLWIWNQGEKGNHIHAIQENIQGMQFSNDGKKLLFWNPNSIQVYFTREWDVQPQREEDDLLVVATFLSPIRNVAWTKQYEHILYTRQDKIHITELDHRDHRVTIDLSPDLSSPPIVLQDFRNDVIYFTAPKDSENTLSVFSFPEKESLF